MATKRRPTRDALATTLREKLAEWRRDARVIEKRTKNDPAVATLTYCAAEIEELLSKSGETAAYLTPEEYAALDGVNANPSTVRRWCAAGQLEGTDRDARGQWWIPATARRVRKRA